MNKSFPTAIMLCVVAVLSFSMLASASTLSVVPVTHVQPLEKYNCQISANNTSASLFINTSADWLIQVAGSNYTNLTGIPQDDDVGIYYVNITTTDFWGTSYNNFTVEVNYDATQSVSASLILTLVIGFGLILMGMIEPRLFFFAGIVWIFAAVAVLYSYGAGWTIIGIGLGMVLLIAGGLSIDRVK